MKYKEYKGLDLVKIGEEVLSFWKQENIFEQSISTRQGKPIFTFYEGPPSANGAPGIHHVMARAVKDIFCRYKTLKGFQVKRKGGWDTHGLPVELQVEKELGITKEDIGVKISIEDYNKKCRETVMRFTAQWNDLTEKMGYWVDLENPYITYTNEYIESLWHLLKRLYDKNLLYKGYTIQPYSPAAGTGLSSHELNLPGCYKDVKDTSIVAQFKAIENEGFKKVVASVAGYDGAIPTYFLAWTTTPWTLPSNAALTVGEKIEYALVSTYNPYTFAPIQVILAKDLLGKYFTEKQKEIALSDYQSGDKLIPFAVLGHLKGAQLVGLRYEQLLPYVQPEGDAFRVIAGDFVTTEDGTGIVHTAPTFGADDFRVAQKAGVPPIVVKDATGKPMPLVDKQGRFVEQVTDYAGMYVKNEYYLEGKAPEKSVDVLISIKLKEENKAFKVEKYEHNYPHCWRTDKPILYYPLESWFIRTTAAKQRMVELNKTINWKPAATGTGRFGNWLENLVDWNLSRSRYWGCPLPVWRTEDGSEEICIGSKAELETELKKAKAAGFANPSSLPDFHRPYVDEIVLVSPSGKPMRRETDLIDVWFDSGAMPFAQWHYPFENQEVFKQSFPADFIAEGVDQTRGWFFTLHAIAVMLEDGVAFKNVVSNGLVLDKDGNKMSKRLGNAVDPFQTIGKYGADATRWYMMENAAPWENLKFNTEGIAEVQRKFFGTLHNTYSFFTLYANLDKFDFSKAGIPVSQRTESDRWIISRLNSLINEVDAAYQDYEPTKACRAIQDFVCDDLSNWYVRLNRKRFWKGEYNQDKLAAYQTLYTCLLTVSKLMSPVAPFYADRLYADLNSVTKLEAATSVHLSFYPQVDNNLIDKDLEEKMRLAQQISSMVHAIRKKEKLKVRLPLSRIIVPDLNPTLTRQIRDVEQIIMAEVNVKKIDFIDDSSDVLVKKIKPNFKKLGQTYKAMMKQVADAITALDKADIRTLEQQGNLALNIQNQEVVITTEDVEILSEDIPGWVTARDNGLTVALDITVTDELKAEGIARDIVNRIQNIRKDSGLEIQDKIQVLFEKSDGFVENALLKHWEYISTEIQAVKIEFTDSLALPQELDLDEWKVNVEVSKV